MTGRAYHKTHSHLWRWSSTVHLNCVLGLILCSAAAFQEVMARIAWQTLFVFWFAAVGTGVAAVK